MGECPQYSDQVSITMHATPESDLSTNRSKFARKVKDKKAKKRAPGGGARPAEPAGARPAALGRSLPTNQQRRRPAPALLSTSSSPVHCHLAPAPRRAPGCGSIIRGGGSKKYIF